MTREEFLADFYNLPIDEVKVALATRSFVPFRRREVMPAMFGCFSQDDMEENCGELDDDGEWKETEENPMDGLDTVEDPSELVALFTA